MSTSDGCGIDESGTNAPWNWRGRQGRSGILIGASALAGCWLASVQTGFETEIFDRFQDDVVASLVALLISATSLVVVGIRLITRSSRTASRNAILVAIGIGSLFVARSRTADIDQAGISMTVLAAPEVLPIVEVSGVLIRVDVDSTPSNRGRDDKWSPVRGLLKVTDASIPAWIDSCLTVRFDRPGGQEVVGAVLRIQGRLHPHGPPSNPGIDHRSRGERRVPATLVVPHAGLTDVCERSHVDINALVTTVRDEWRSAIDRIDRRMSEIDESVAPGLFTALLTGRRSGLDSDFRIAAIRSGLAHLLAISGLHLAVIAVIAGACSSALINRPSRLAEAMPILAVLVFGMLVIPGPSVQRAVLMSVAFGIFELSGRRVQAGPLVFLTLAAMCWSDPIWPRSVGFQLTAVATIALVCSMSSSRLRWFGPADRVGSMRRSLILDRLRMAASAGIVAWSATMPIVVANFGVASLVSVPATMVGSLPLGPILGLGVVAGFAESWVPGFLLECSSGLIALPLGFFSRFVNDVGAMVSPISTTTSGMGLLLSVPMAVAVAVLGGCSHRGTRWIGLTVVILTASLCFGVRNTSVSPRVRMIDVGDGSAIVVRSGRKALLYDAGSNSRSDCGTRVIIPTLRRIGIRKLDAIVISHANADHFGAVPEIVGLMPVGRLITTEPFITEARSGRRPILQSLLETLHERDVPIEIVARGDRFNLDRLDFRVIHPAPNEDNRSVNDSSLVVAVRVDGMIADSGSDLLLTGDIQDEGIARVLAREQGLKVSVLEIPHHGSWRPIAAEMVRILDPAVVIQSTGRRRWRHDRFGGVCAGRHRHVTARDGSFMVDLAVD